MAPSAPPTTQKACIVAQRGRPSSALEFRSDWPVPSKIPEGHVLIKVQAGALNPVSVLPFFLGAYSAKFPFGRGVKFMKILPNFVAGRPHIAEYDVTGTIVDPNGTRFAVGDAVFGVILPLDAIKTRQGALAQYVTASSKWLTSRPDNITATEAAGLTIAGMTALNAIQIAKLESGQTVFINGGSSAVGAFTIQVAKAKGCRVVASASGPNEEFVRNLGADEVGLTAGSINPDLSDASVLTG
jgi:NADPH:quinone reductase-like Zn-dependent oxidoreductase